MVPPALWPYSEATGFRAIFSSETASLGGVKLFFIPHVFGTPSTVTLLLRPVPPPVSMSLAVKL